MNNKLWQSVKFVIQAEYEVLIESWDEVHGQVTGSLSCARVINSDLAVRSTRRSCQGELYQLIWWYFWSWYNWTSTIGNKKQVKHPSWVGIFEDSTAKHPIEYSGCNKSRSIPESESTRDITTNQSFSHSTSHACKFWFGGEQTQGQSSDWHWKLTKYFAVVQSEEMVMWGEDRYFWGWHATEGFQWCDYWVKC